MVVSIARASGIFTFFHRKEDIMKHSSLHRVMAIALALLMVAATVPMLMIGASAEEEKNIVITLDPGHGPQKTGTNGAVQYGGVNEHFYTYSMALYAKERLEQFQGVTVHITRTADNTPELYARPQYAADRNSDAFVSIHINSANTTAGGTEIWVPNNNWRPEIANKSRAAATPILEKIISTFDLKNRGLKTSDSATGTKYPDGTLADKLTVIKGGKELNIPVVMLIEVAFADNKSDYEKVFATEEGLKKAGYAIADGLAQYYALNEGPSVVHVSNDELRLMNENKEQIGQPFAPGQFDKWDNKVIELEEGSVYSLIDWGWAALRCKSFQYGYIVNGEEMFDDAFTHETEKAVTDSIAVLGGNNGARFMGVLPTEKLKIGENTVQFCVKLNGETVEVLREYKVVVTEAPTEAPTDPPTEPPTEAPTDAPTEAPTDAPTTNTDNGCNATLLSLGGVVALVALGGAVLLRKKED